MSVKTIVVAILIFVGGIFVGREEMKYEFASAVTNAFAGVANAFSSAPLVHATPAKENAEELAKKAEEAKKAKDAADYGEKNIQIYDFVSKYINIRYASKEKVPGVRFKVKNTGDRTVMHLCVKVFYQDAENKDIAEERFCPVLADNQYSMSNKTPLRAGYIWQDEPDNFYTAKKVPAEWKEGATTVRIDDIRLE